LTQDISKVGIRPPIPVASPPSGVVASTRGFPVECRPAMNRALVRVDGEAPVAEARQEVHVTGFAGQLLLLDYVLFLCLWSFYVLITAFLFAFGAYRWFTTGFITLTAIVLIFIADLITNRLRKQRISMRDHSIRRFMYGMPSTIFCFYSHFIISKNKDCSWYLLVENHSLRIIVQVGTYVAGCVGILSLALAAMRIDCNGSCGVSQRVREGRRYALWHVLFRATECLFRMGAAVYLCECLRAHPWAHQVNPLIFFCIPLGLAFLYALVFQFANQAGGKPTDDMTSCLVLGIVTLAINPMHFIAMPGYDAAARKANTYLFLIRVLELVIVVGVIYATTAVSVPRGICDHANTGADLIRGLGPEAIVQVIFALAVHYLIMTLHSEIQHSTCQALTDDQADGTAPNAGMAFPMLNPAERSLYVAPPPADAGLCQAWVKLGGGLPILPVAERIEAEQLEEYHIRSVLGGGTFGVVVKVEKVGANMGRAPQIYAMMLLNTSVKHTLKLAEREANIYSTIWLKMRELSPGYHRVGHPNIARLYFWSSFTKGQEFHMQDQGGTRVVRHSVKGFSRFHMALMMEHCDTNLAMYLDNHEVRADWFLLVVHFLAEILLALEYLHKADVAYRDLSLSNVLIVRRPGTNPGVHCKLGDFGYGRMVDPQAHTHNLSVAGSPYFCAPEMEKRYQTGDRLEVSQAEENALDGFSYGTVGYALGTGPHYNKEADSRKMGDRKDHPRCQTAGKGRCQSCPGCEVLEDLRQRLLPVDPSGQLADLASRCVAPQAAQRPSMTELRAEGLFQGVDFEALTRLDI